MSMLNLAWLPADPPNTERDRDTRDRGLGPELHGITVKPMLGDWWAMCSCSAISLAFESEESARCWVCPREFAEREVARNQRRFQARITDATMAGYR